MAPEIDAGEFRAGQQRDWNTASKGWRDWHDLIDTATHRVSERMVEMAEIGQGDSVLDVAAGYGEPSLTAARFVGPEGRVVATDISTGMLDYGRERAAEAGLEQVEFIEADAASLDFPEQSFDAALSRWGIIFEPDGEAALARIRSFLDPGAKMAISSWGSPERVPMLSIPMKTAMERLDVPPPPPGTPGPLSRPTPEAIGGLLEAGGFHDVETDEMELTMEWENAEDFTRFIREIAPPVTAMLEPHPADVQEETWAAITEAAGRHADDDGRLRLRNLALVAAGSA